MVTVFIAGHGRMDVGAPCPMVVPERMTLRFAVPASFGSSSSVSNSMLKGINHLFSETVPAFGSYQEHYLVPDGGEIMLQKADSLLEGTKANPRLPGPASEYWLLQPRNRNAVPLSSILDYLKKKFATGAITVCWTCCRSPIGQFGLLKTTYDPGTNSYRSSFTDKFGRLLPEWDKPVKNPEAEDEYEVKHILAAGVVTLICAAEESTMKNEATWPGKNGVGKRRSF